MSQAKYVAITGATSPIGSETAKLFNRAGYETLLVARDPDKGEQLDQELGLASLLLADLTDPTHIEEIAGGISKHTAGQPLAALVLCQAARVELDPAGDAINNTSKVELVKQLRGRRLLLPSSTVTNVTPITAHCYGDLTIPSGDKQTSRSQQRGELALEDLIDGMEEPPVLARVASVFAVDTPYYQGLITRTSRLDERDTLTSATTTKARLATAIFDVSTSGDRGLSDGVVVVGSQNSYFKRDYR